MLIAYAGKAHESPVTKLIRNIDLSLNCSRIPLFLMEPSRLVVALFKRHVLCFFSELKRHLTFNLSCKCKANVKCKISRLITFHLIISNTKSPKLNIAEGLLPFKNNKYNFSN